MNNTKNLIKLINENPELPIVPMVASEVVADDCCGYWLGRWGTCSVGEYACYGERFYEDRDDLEDAYYCKHDDEYEGMAEDEIEKDIKAKTESMWTKAIIVCIGATG